MYRKTLMAFALIAMIGTPLLAQVQSGQTDQPAGANTTQPGATQPQANQPGTQQNVQMGNLQNSPLGRFARDQIVRFLALATEVNLSPDQTNRLQQIFMSHKDQIVQHAERLWKARVALRDAVLAQQTDEQAIRQAAQNLGQAVGDAAVVASQMKQQIAPVLTENQRQAIVRFMEGSDRATRTFFADITQGQQATPTQAETPTQTQTR